MSSSTSEDYEEKEIQPPSFFKILLQSQHNSDKVLIPNEFTKTFGGVITKTVLLQDSMGKLWNVKLESIGTRLAMTDGWQRFVNAHNLSRGNWILFNYIGNYKFSVQSFGIDCCAKEEYVPIKVTSRKKLDKETEAKPKAENKNHLGFDKHFSKLRDYFEIPRSVARSCNVDPPEEMILRTVEGDACRVTIRKVDKKLVVESSRLMKFWEMVNVEAGDKCQFRVVFGSNNTIQEIVLVKVSAFVSKLGNEVD